MTGDLKLNVLLDAFTHANCSACKTDSNNFEQLFDKLLLKTLSDFLPLPPFFLPSKADFRVEYSFNVVFRVEYMINLSLM